MRVAHSRKLFLHRAVGVAGALGVLCIAGCTHKDKGKSDSTAAPPDTSSAADTSAARDSADQKILALGILGKPGQDAATMTYLTTHTYVSPPAATEIIDEDVDCKKDNVHHYSHLRILPVDYAHEIPWGKVAGSGRSHLYARIEVSKANCPNVGLNLNEQGYLTLHGDAGNQLVVEVFKKTLTGAVPTNITTQHFRFCLTDKAAKPGTHFWSSPHCPEGPIPFTRTTQAAKQPLKIVLASMLPTMNFMAVFLDSGIWVSCSTGCCEVQF